MKFEKNKFYIIITYDHFSSNNPTDQYCQAEFIGRCIFENDIYVRLRHIKADILNDNSGEEYHQIVKSAIYYAEELVNSKNNTIDLELTSS